MLVKMSIEIRVCTTGAVHELQGSYDQVKLVARLCIIE